MAPSSSRPPRARCGSRRGGRKPCLLSLVDAADVARILEGLGRLLWDLGVRDAPPSQRRWCGGALRWRLDGAELNVSRSADVVVLSLSAPLELPPGPLVEVVQALDHLVR